MYFCLGKEAERDFCEVCMARRELVCARGEE